MSLILNEFFKDIFDETYGHISYGFDVESKKVIMIKNGERKILGSCSIDGLTNSVTFHKLEKPDGFLRIPEPSWTIHKHLIDCGIIDYIEYQAENNIYKISAREAAFCSTQTRIFDGEPKLCIPIKFWKLEVIAPKVTQSDLEKTLSKVVDTTWIPFFSKEYEKPYFKSMMSRIKVSRDKGVSILPSKDNVFYAFKVTPLTNVRVVILGQDPYPNKDHAHGLAFSSKSKNTPASLRNIYEEIKRTNPDFKRSDNDLTDWALQGVFLLNSILTVTEGQPESHKVLPWLDFTGQAIGLISKQDRPIVWMLWGKYAFNLYKNFAYQNKRHLVLSCGHPSPMSVHLFKGCDHFTKCNSYLTQNQLPEIKW